MTTTAVARRAPWGSLLLACAVWVAAYANLAPFADVLIGLLGWVIVIVVVAAVSAIIVLIVFRLTGSASR